MRAIGFTKKIRCHIIIRKLIAKILYLESIIFQLLTLMLQSLTLMLHTKELLLRYRCMGFNRFSEFCGEWALKSKFEGGKEMENIEFMASNMNLLSKKGRKVLKK